MLRAWLSARADSPPRNRAAPWPAQETVIRQRCTVEEAGPDGFSVERCEEVRERFRLAADGWQLVETSSSTSVRPVGNDASSGPEAPSAQPYSREDLALASRYLDEFFDYASQLALSWDAQGLEPNNSSSSSSSSSSNTKPEQWQQQQQQPHSSSGGSRVQPSLAGWWQRKRLQYQGQQGQSQQQQQQQQQPEQQQQRQQQQPEERQPSAAAAAGARLHSLPLAGPADS